MKCKNCCNYVLVGRDSDGNLVTNYCELYGVPYLEECPMEDDTTCSYQKEDNND
jgi:hypothetical protein